MIDYANRRRHYARADFLTCKSKGNIMTRRTMFLFFLALLAAAPLVWMSVDPNAGNTLVALTDGAKAQVSVAKSSISPR